MQQPVGMSIYIGFEGPVIDSMMRNSFYSPGRQLLEVGLNEELVSLFSRAFEIAETEWNILSTAL